MQTFLYFVCVRYVIKLKWSGVFSNWR